MPTSKFSCQIGFGYQIELLPTSFGMWSGPSWAGGAMLTEQNGNTSPEKFIELYAKVNAMGFLDAGPRMHDMGYEYAERMYGATTYAQEQEHAGKTLYPAAGRIVTTIADMDLLKNVLSYRPQSVDFIGGNDKDFIGIRYQEMLVNVFYLMGVWAYHLGPQVHKFWVENLKGINPDPKLVEPDFADLPSFIKNGLPIIFGDAQKWNLSQPNNGFGLEMLTTSDFLGDSKDSDNNRFNNYGLTQQEMLLFNQHLALAGAGQQVLSKQYLPNYYTSPINYLYGGLANPSADALSANNRSYSANIDNRLVIPYYDKDNNIFVFAGTLNGQQVEMTLSNIRDPKERNFTYIIKNAAGENVEKREWKVVTDNGFNPESFEFRYTGNRTYNYTRSVWVKNGNQSNWVIAQTEVVDAPKTPAGTQANLFNGVLIKGNDRFSEWEKAVQNQTWLSDNPATLQADMAMFQSYLFTGYEGPTDITGLKDLYSTSLKALSQSRVEELVKLAVDPSAEQMQMRFALTHLEPFLRTGGSFDDFNRDGSLDLYNPETGKGGLTKNYLSDRAALLDAVMYPWKNVPWQASMAGAVLAAINGWNAGLSGTLKLLSLVNLLNSKYQYRDLSFADYTIGKDNTESIIVFGTEKADVLDAGTKTGHLYGGDGEDMLFGKGGDDYLEGGADNDQLYGRGGKDILFGGSGNDLLEGGAGEDTLEGGLGFDTYVIGEGKDTIIDAAPEGATKEGEIKLNGAVLDGSKYFIKGMIGTPLKYLWSEGVWRDNNDASILYVLRDGKLDGKSDLLICNTSGDNLAVIKNFKDGDLGIKLNTTRKVGLLASDKPKPFTVQNVSEPVSDQSGQNKETEANVPPPID